MSTKIDEFIKGASHNQLVDALKSGMLKYKHQILTDDMVLQARELNQLGLSWNAIGKRFKVTPITIRKRVEALPANSTQLMSDPDRPF